MRTAVDVREPSRSLVVRPSAEPTTLALVRPRRGGGSLAASATIVARVIDVDIRQQAPDARAVARAHQAASRYGVHGTSLLGEVRANESAAQVARQDAPEGWTLVGRWLILVAVLSALAVMLASLGTHAAG